MTDSYCRILEGIRGELDVDLEVCWQNNFNKGGADTDSLVAAMRKADLSIIYRMGPAITAVTDAAIMPVKDEMNIMSFGSSPDRWALTSVDHDLAIRCYEYVKESGVENIRRMIDAIEKGMGWKEGEPLPVVRCPSQGILDPVTEKVYTDTETYIEESGIDRSRPFVGIIGTKTSYQSDAMSVEQELFRELDGDGINPILVFVPFSGNAGDDARGQIDNIRHFFTKDGKPIVDALVKTSQGAIQEDKSQDPLDSDAMRFLAEMNVPIYRPVILYRMAEDQWLESAGLTTDVSGQVTIPEFEGQIEPFVIGSNIGHTDTGENIRVGFDERIRSFCRRVSDMVRLRHTPNSEKRLVIFLNNFPCTGAEANVGNASGLDTMESVAAILKRLKAEGYDVDPPEDGAALIKTILDRKAISEFRWTTAAEIKAHGGVFYEMDMAEYMDYFSSLPERVRDDVIREWGDPPGKSMVLDGRFIITGVPMGRNVVVAVEPKRGCYGSRCDGEVCKILQDPDCPPTHQFLAAYHYFEDIWDADMVLHTGTHAAVEWLPGKGVGLSEFCYPDICMRNVPHFYIYNTDVPSEAVVAKRRSYATLVDHMQHTLTGVNLSGFYQDLNVFLTDYVTAKNDPAHAEAFRTQLLEMLDGAKVGIPGLDDGTPVEECVRLCYETLSKVRNSRVNLGMHTFGKIPEGRERVDEIESIIKFVPEGEGLRDSIAELMGLDLSELYESQGSFDEARLKSFGELISDVDSVTRIFIAGIIAGLDTADSLRDAGLDFEPDRPERMAGFVELIREVDRRIAASDEMGSLMNAFNGGFVSPGPGGCTTRGSYNILPTGRNLYTSDPYAVPTRTAWKVGCTMSEKTIRKHLEDEGRYPESIGISWTMGDVISTGGEAMAEIMCLMGAEPVWEPNGRVKRFRIIPLEELGRPRIDMTVSVSGLVRDGYSNLIEYLSEMIDTVFGLDEPEEMNFVRKHTMESVRGGMEDADAGARMFGPAPNTYGAGVSLAVFASAWKEDKDLVDIYLKSKGHGYGGGRNGKPMFEQFATVMSKNDAVLDRTTSDGSDLLVGGHRFAGVGGMVTASRYLSGKDVKSYCGDSRDPRDVQVVSTSEEINRVMRAKLFNPEWLEEMKKYGYKGANDITKRVVHLYGWQTTTREVDPRLFDEVVHRYLDDQEMLEFLKDSNPYALEEMTRRLLEANSRGLWDTDEETMGILQNVYLELEADLEDAAGEGEFQGGNVDIFRTDNVEEWNRQMSEITDMTSRFRKRNVGE